MKKFLYLFIAWSTPVFADDDAGILWVNNDITKDRLRNGDITMKDIPIMIASVIEMLLLLAGTISVVALIYHAIRMQLASGITGDASWVDKAKSGMKWALLGFVLSMSAWFLMSKFVAIIAAGTAGN
jgi:hypothetical protein